MKYLLWFLFYRKLRFNKFVEEWGRGGRGVEEEEERKKRFFRDYLVGILI